MTTAFYKACYDASVRNITEFARKYGDGMDLEGE